MKPTRDQLFLTLIYLGGINIYYALWYLGSDGQALLWGEPGLNFRSHWLATNLASMLNAWIIVGLINGLDRKNECLKMPKVAPFILLVSLLVFGILFSLIITVQAIYFNATSVLEFFKSKVFVSIKVYHLLVAALMMLLHLAAIRAGGVLSFFKLLFKKTKEARPVERGFAFIDLNRSTQIAEKLGHYAYSEFLRACFGLLDEVLARFPNFEIYQYVGDEAVITWRVDAGSSENALALYEQFILILERQRNWFQNRFDLAPVFKCAIHSGEVMESELGARKPQTAYHGDVLNMASRILGLCHIYHTSLLLSQDYKKLISNKLVQNMSVVEHEFINGKSRKMLLYKPKKDTIAVC